MSKYLDKDGLAHLWERIQELVATCGGGASECACPLCVHCDTSPNEDGEPTFTPAFSEVWEAYQNERAIYAVVPYGQSAMVYQLGMVWGDLSDELSVSMGFFRATGSQSAELIEIFSDNTWTFSQ